MFASKRRIAAFTALIWASVVWAGAEDTVYDRGLGLFERGFYQASYRDFQEYLNQNPGGEWADAAQFYLGRCLLAVGSYHEAISEYKRVITNYPTSRLVSSSFIEIGDCHTALKSYGEAVATYERSLAVATDPTDKVTAYLKLGESHFLNNDVENAIATYKKSLALYPEQEYAAVLNYRLGLLTLLQENLSESRAYFDAAGTGAANRSAAADAAYGEGLLAYIAKAPPDEATEKEKDAVAAFERAVSSDPSPPYVLGLAASCLAASRPAAAAAALERVDVDWATDAPVRVEAERYYVIGLAYAEMGDAGAASNAFRTFVEVYPDSPWYANAVTWLGRLAFQEGQYDAAAEYFRTVIASDTPSHDQALYWLAWCYFVREDYARARDTFRQIEQRGAEPLLKPYAYYWAAEAAGAAGDIAQAKSDFADMAATYSDHALADNAVFRKARLEAKEGKTAAARETLTGLVARYPERELGDDAAYLIGRSLLDEGNPEAAAAAMWSLAKRYPDSPYAPAGVFDIAQNQFRAHRFKDAAGTLSALLELYPYGDNAAEALFLLGECYLNQNQFDQAQKTYTTLVERFPKSPRVDEARYEIELCNLKKGKYESQIELAKSYIAMYPQSHLNGELLILLGEYYYHRRDFAQAENYLTAVASTRSEKQTLLAAQQKLAEVLLAGGKTNSAIAKYRTVAATAEDKTVAGDALLNVAFIYEKRGDAGAAVETYTDLVERFPGILKAPFAQYQIGVNLRSLKMYPESNAALGSLLRRWPDGEYMYTAELLIGLNYRDIGASAQARDHLLVAAEKGPRDVAVQAYYTLGEVELDLNNAHAARSYFTKVITNYRDFAEWARKANAQLR